MAAELSGEHDGQYKVADFGYIGRISATPRVLVVRTGYSFRTFKDMLSTGRSFILGASGPGGSTYLDAVVTGHLFSLNQQVINGSADIRLALLRGDVEAMWGSAGSLRKGVAAGDFRAITHTSRKPAGYLAGVPSIFSFARDFPSDHQSLLAAWAALSETGRPLVAPPGTPHDRLMFLREAL